MSLWNELNDMTKEKRDAVLNHDDTISFSDYEMEQMYNDMLDDRHEECTIAGFQYSTSRALRLVDETAYDCGFSDFTWDNRFIEWDGRYYDSESIEQVIEQLNDQEESDNE